MAAVAVVSSHACASFPITKRLSSGTGAEKMPVPNVSLQPQPLVFTGIFSFPNSKVHVTWVVQFYTGLNIGFLQKGLRALGSALVFSASPMSLNSFMTELLLASGSSARRENS